MAFHPHKRRVICRTLAADCDSLQADTMLTKRVAGIKDPTQVHDLASGDLRAAGRERQPQGDHVGVSAVALDQGRLVADFICRSRA